MPSVGVARVGGPILRLWVGGKELRLLGDTGAAVSILRRPIPGRPIQPYTGELRGVSGRLRTQGMQEVECRFGDKQLTHPMIIAEMPLEHDGLLGVDLLRRFGRPMMEWLVQALIRGGQEGGAEFRQGGPQRTAHEHAWMEAQRESYAQVVASLPKREPQAPTGDQLATNQQRFIVHMGQAIEAAQQKYGRPTPQGPPTRGECATAARNPIREPEPVAPSEPPSRPEDGDPRGPTTGSPVPTQMAPELSPEEERRWKKARRNKAAKHRRKLLARRRRERETASISPRAPEGAEASLEVGHPKPEGPGPTGDPQPGSREEAAAGGRTSPANAQDQKKGEPGSRGNPSFAKVVGAVNIPPWSEVVIPFTSPYPSGTEFLLEPHERQVPKGLKIGRSIHAEGPLSCVLRAVNLTAGPIQIRKHQTLGVVTRLTEWVDTSRRDRTEEGGVEPEEVICVVKEEEELGTVFARKLTHLLPQERATVSSLLMEYQDLFQEPGPEGCQLPVQHTIDTGDARPIAKRPYRVAYSQRQIIQQQLDDMLSKGIIQPSHSPWSAPVVLVPKKTDSGETKWRFCTDFRALNEITRKDVYPLPNIQETLENLGGSKLFTTLDLASGYHQIPVSEEDRAKTGFTTFRGHFEYLRMPFGLCNAPSTFQRLMDQLLIEIKDTECFVYLDDIIIFAENLEQHLERLQRVFTRLRQANLKVQLKKCTFLSPEVNYLGHIVGQEGVRADPAKLVAVREFPVPRNPREVKGFLGLAGYYRRFVGHFADIAKPLTQLTRKGVDFDWGEAQQRAFNDLKEALCSDSVLVYPQFDKPFTLATDASQLALGAVLSQDQDGLERPVAYISRQTTTAEANYDSVKRECLAVVWAIDQFRCYLYGRQFRLITDCWALQWLKTLKDTSPLLVRWSLRLAEYDYSVEHRPGKRHANADGLSRARAIAAVQERGWQLEVSPDLGRKQEAEWDPEWLQKRCTKDKRGVWYRVEGVGRNANWRLLVPRGLQEQVMTMYHDAPWAGHPGRDSMRESIGRKYYWPGMNKGIEAYQRTCLECNRRRSAGAKAPIQMPDFPSRPFELVSMDVVGPLPRTRGGKRFLLTMVDHLTRYAEAFPLKEHTAEEVARCLVHDIVVRHGVPEKLLTDQGREFTSRLLKQTCRLLGVTKLQTTPYHPECNGKVERFHGTLLKILKRLAKEGGGDWDKWLPYALMAYRSMEHSATGFSPHYLLYGRELGRPGETGIDPELSADPEIEDLRQKLNRARRVAERVTRNKWAKRTRRLNARRRLKEFQEGDTVYLHVPVKPAHVSAKFHCPWTGPHRVKARTSDVNYRIQLSQGGEVVVHVDRLKPAYARGESSEEEEEEGMEFHGSPPAAAPNPEMEEEEDWLEGPGWSGAELGAGPHRQEERVDMGESVDDGGTPEMVDHQVDSPGRDNPTAAAMATPTTTGTTTHTTTTNTQAAATMPWPGPSHPTNPWAVGNSVDQLLPPWLRRPSTPPEPTSANPGVETSPHLSDGLSSLPTDPTGLSDVTFPTPRSDATTPGTLSPAEWDRESGQEAPIDANPPRGEAAGETGEVGEARETAGEVVPQEGERRTEESTEPRRTGRSRRPPAWLSEYETD